MAVDLSEQWQAFTAEAWLVSPGGMPYARRTTRTRRRTCDELIHDGAPLVQYYWAGGQLDWFDGGADAAQQWRVVRQSVISQEPRPDVRLQWTAGVWEDEAGRKAVVLTGHC